MRLDKFLKTTRIIKRRTIATELAGAGKILVNGISKKAAYDVKQNDELLVSYYNREIKVKVLEVPSGNLKKEEIENYIKIMGE